MRLEIKDAVMLHRWLASDATWAEVQSLHSIGLAGNVRFTERAREEFFRLWAWSAPRFSGVAGLAQEEFFTQYGSAALDRRYRRVRNLIAQYRQGRIRCLPVRS